MPDSVNYYIKKIEQYGEIYAKYSACCLKIESALKRKGNNRDMQTWNQLICYRDSVDKITKTEAVSKCQSLYDYTQREKENVRLKSENEYHKLLLIILGLSAFLLVILFYVYYTKNKYAKEKQQRQMEELQHLLDKSTLQVLNNKKALTRIKESEIYALFKGKIRAGQNVTQEEWNKLDKAVNDYFIDFKLKLYRICKLSDLEYQICLLLKMELSLADIAVLVHREPSTITMSRKRLYKKLFQKEGKAEELDVFIRSV